MVCWIPKLIRVIWGLVNHIKWFLVRIIQLFKHWQVWRLWLSRSPFIVQRNLIRLAATNPKLRSRAPTLNTKWGVVRLTLAVSAKWLRLRWPRMHGRLHLLRRQRTLTTRLNIIYVVCFGPLSPYLHIMLNPSFLRPYSLPSQNFVW